MFCVRHPGRKEQNRNCNEFVMNYKPNAFKVIMHFMIQEQKSFTTTKHNIFSLSFSNLQTMTAVLNAERLFRVVSEFTTLNIPLALAGIVFDLPGVKTYYAEESGVKFPSHRYNNQSSRSTLNVR